MLIDLVGVGGNMEHFFLVPKLPTQMANSVKAQSRLVNRSDTEITQVITCNQEIISLQQYAHLHKS